MLVCPVLACLALAFPEWVCLVSVCLVLVCLVWCPGSVFQVRWCPGDAQMSPAVLTEHAPDPLTPCPSGGPAAAAKAAAKAAKYGKLRSLWGYSARLDSCSSPLQAAPVLGLRPSSAWGPWGLG